MKAARKIEPFFGSSVQASESPVQKTTAASGHATGPSSRVRVSPRRSCQASDERQHRHDRIERQQQAGLLRADRDRQPHRQARQGREREQVRVARQEPRADDGGDEAGDGAGGEERRARRRARGRARGRRGRAPRPRGRRCGGRAASRRAAGRGRRSRQARRSAPESSLLRCPHDHGCTVAEPVGGHGQRVPARLQRGAELQASRGERCRCACRASIARALRRSARARRTWRRRRSRSGRARARRTGSGSSSRGVRGPRLPATSREPRLMR